MDGLTALQVKHAKPGRYADGNGLYLHVRGSGSRAWVLRVKVDGKRRDLGLGSTDKLGLAQARIKAANYVAKLKAREELEPSPGEPAREIPTFAEAARACHEAIKAGWKNKRHSDSWLSSLEGHICPHLGDKPIDSITSAMVRTALAPIWLKIPETARRILQRVGTVLDFAHIEGWCPYEASLRSVTKGLPRQPVMDSHFVAMPYEEVPTLFTTFEKLPVSPGRDALTFTILNAARSGETRLSRWPEFDLEAMIWNIPATRMKMKKSHTVPLAAAAAAILKRRWTFREADDGLVFSNCGTKPLSDMTMTKVLRDLGFKSETVHGFRSSFTDWAAEMTAHPKEVVDKALAHKLVDRVEAAYRRTDFFERRRCLMDDWAKFCAGKVGR